MLSRLKKITRFGFIKKSFRKFHTSKIKNWSCIKIDHNNKIKEEKITSIDSHALNPAFEPRICNLIYMEEEDPLLKKIWKGDLSNDFNEYLSRYNYSKEFDDKFKKFSRLNNKRKHEIDSKDIIIKKRKRYNRLFPMNIKPYIHPLLYVGWNENMINSFSNMYAGVIQNGKLQQKSDFRCDILDHNTPKWVINGNFTGCPYPFLRNHLRHWNDRYGGNFKEIMNLFRDIYYYNVEDMSLINKLLLEERKSSMKRLERNRDKLIDCYFNKRRTIDNPFENIF